VSGGAILFGIWNTDKALYIVPLRAHPTYLANVASQGASIWSSPSAAEIVVRSFIS
jgi:hypothetical protein